MALSRSFHLFSCCRLAALGRGALTVLAAVLLAACSQPNRHVAEGVFHSAEGTESQDAAYDLPDIQATGELIILTLYGPSTYFEFRGEPFGTQYTLAQAFAQSIGVSTRVEVCKSPEQMVEKLERGEADMIACSTPVAAVDTAQVACCGAEAIGWLLDTLATVQRDPSLRLAQPGGWMVRQSSPLLAQSLNQWIDDNEFDFLDIVTPRFYDDNQQVRLPRRTASAPIRNLQKGEISVYDHLFRRYAPQCRWDWRLLAAQAYQESAFDPAAVSFMGAMGLMQLMPATARRMGVSQGSIFKAEDNLRGAVKFIRQLDQHYSGIASQQERICFVLAAYNAGPGHVDDARTLARKQGRNPNRWADVAPVVLLMSQPQYYNDPDVRHGYFRGSETANYVQSIRARYDAYRKKIRN